MQFLYSSLSNEEYKSWLTSRVISRYKDVQVKEKLSKPKEFSNYWFYMGMLLMFIGCFIVPVVFKMFSF